MKDLQDIQNEVAELEKTVHTVLERLQNIHESLDMVKIERKSDKEENTLRFEDIKNLSGSIPFVQHFLKNYHETTLVRTYLVGLIQIIILDKDAKENASRMAFIEWLRQQSGVNLSFSDLFRISYQENGVLHKWLRQFIVADFVYLFCVDALLVSHIGGKASSEVDQYLSILCKSFDLSRFNIKILTVIAVWILTKRRPALSDEEEKTTLEFLAKDIFTPYRRYLNVEKIDAEKEINPLKNIDWSNRENQGEARHIIFRIKYGDSFLCIVKQGNYVVQGELVAKSGRHLSTKHRTDGKGYFYCIMDHGMIYGVISKVQSSQYEIQSWVRIQEGR